MSHKRAKASCERFRSFRICINFLANFSRILLDIFENICHYVTIVDRQLAYRRAKMKLLLELVYAEIHSLAENISYLKGRCDSILEMCTTHRFAKKGKRAKTKYEKELYSLEEDLQKIKNRLCDFSEQTSDLLYQRIKIFEDEINKKRSMYIKTMQGND